MNADSFSSTFILDLRCLCINLHYSIFLCYHSRPRFSGSDCGPWLVIGHNGRYFSKQFTYDDIILKHRVNKTSVFFTLCLKATTFYRGYVIVQDLRQPVSRLCLLGFWMNYSCISLCCVGVDNICCVGVFIYRISIIEWQLISIIKTKLISDVFIMFDLLFIDCMHIVASGSFRLKIKGY